MEGQFLPDQRFKAQGLKGELEIRQWLSSVVTDGQKQNEVVPVGIPWTQDQVVDRLSMTGEGY